MQSGQLIQRAVLSARPATAIKSCTGHLTQVRNHVKIYPWRFSRTKSECYLDPTRTPYTDRHNINEFKSSKKEKKEWMKVIPKDKDNRFNAYKWHDAYTSNPVEAKNTASRRLQSLQDSLKSRGRTRESKPYDPPANVEETIISIVKASLSNSATSDSQNNVEHSSHEDILNIDLDQVKEFKFNLITMCISKFQHDLPSSCLNDVKQVRDLVDYYLTPVRGIDAYTSLLNKNDALPPNLSLVPEAHRYDKETDERFKGLTAYPGLVSKVPGLRGSKKYPILNQEEFQWPDI